MSLSSVQFLACCTPGNDPHFIDNVCPVCVPCLCHPRPANSPLVRQVHWGLGSLPKPPSSCLSHSAPHLAMPGYGFPWRMWWPQGHHLHRSSPDAVAIGRILQPHLDRGFLFPSLGSWFPALWLVSVATGTGLAWLCSRTWCLEAVVFYAFQTSLVTGLYFPAAANLGKKSPVWSQLLCLIPWRRELGVRHSKLSAGLLFFPSQLILRTVLSGSCSTSRQDAE